jgi:16S rRNA processing protein RimM
MKEKNLVHIGTFGQPQGLKGDIKINILTSSLESFKALKKYFIEDRESVLVFKELRKVGKKIIGSLEKCKDRDAAFLFKGKHILTLRENFPQIKNDKFYVIDLIECEVVDIKNNFLGRVKDISNFGAGDLIEIKDIDKKSFFIPMNDENLVKVDIVKKIIIVNPMKGLLD